MFIPDPGSNDKKKEEGEFIVLPFFVAKNFTGSYRKTFCQVTKN
jgi:hypothetical protein